nr:abc transporter g family member 11 [Quercus suber]
MQSNNRGGNVVRTMVPKENGVFLTWEDLWVTVTNGKEGRKSILEGVTGYAQPGELLAIMGPSGCGKSTLLDSLAGRSGSNTRQSGEILINGLKQKLGFGISAYVTQYDTLMTTLTVGEAMYYSAQLQLPDSMSKSKKKEIASITIKEMGLEDAMNTRIGRSGSNTRQSGEILINGLKQKLGFGISAYVTQYDTLMTTLTVGEAMYYSAQLQLPDSMSKSKKKEIASITIKEMGLEDAMNTRIGGSGAKGISSGQKRRVSICIEILTRPKLLFLDEPTSGLDSAASYYVMSRIASLHKRDGIRRTIIASIHQPISEVFQVFHDLCLLSSGRTVYFGPASTATEFFATNGFPCLTLQNPSDHFLKTINKDFGKDLEQGLDGGIPTEEAINSLTRSYKSSEIYQQVRRQVSEICTWDWGALEKKRNHAGFVIQCLVLTRRSFVNIYRDIGYYWLRLAIYVALAMGLATVFYDVGSSYAYASIQVRGSLIMFITSFLTLMTIGGFPSFVEDMKVFDRERLNGHYGTAAFIISNSFSAVPYLLLISLIPGAIAYYPSGLQKGAEHFLFFASIIFACMMLVESLMMIVASIVPNLLMGIITGAGVQGLMMLGGGIFRYPNDLLKPFWKYPLYYISFHKYAYQGLFKNEFEKLTFSIDEAGGPTNISGKEILRNKLQMEMGYSKWVDLAILLGMVVLYRLLFLGFIKTTEMIKPFVTTFMSAPPKQTTQVMVNPSTAPSV